MKPTQSLLTAPLIADSGGELPAGVIAASNESRFQTANYNEPLTAYTVGWTDPEDVPALLESIAPAVDAPRRFSFKKAVNSEAFLSEDDDVRGIGASFKRVEFTGSEVEAKTLNKGLTVRVDHDEDAIGGDWQERFTGFLLQRLARNELRRNIALLIAGATNAAKVWSTSTNPDKDLRDALRLGKNAGGIRPNVMLWGGAAWDLRMDAYEGQDTPYAGRAAGMSQDDLARKLMIQRNIVSEAVYQSGATSKADIVGSIVLAYYARSGMMKDEPSNIKRFVTPTDAGRYKVYAREHEKFTDITVEHYSRSYITNSLGIRQITVSAS